MCFLNRFCLLVSVASKNPEERTFDLELLFETFKVTPPIEEKLKLGIRMSFGDYDLDGHHIEMDFVRHKVAPTKRQLL
jgi:hypothetical protein